MDAALALLDDVGEFVTEELLAFFGAWVVLAFGEVEIVAFGEGVGAERFGCRPGGS